MFVVVNQMVYFMNNNMFESDCCHSYENMFLGSN